MNPDDEMARAAALYREGRRRDAEALFRELAQRHAGDGAALLRLADLASQLGESAVAAQLAERGSRLLGNSPERELVRGIEHARAGRHADAAAAFERAIMRRPDFVEAHFNLARVEGELGRADRQIATLRRVIALAPDLAKAHLALGVALSGQDDLAGAIECYGRALRAAPDYAEAHYNLGNARRRVGDLDAAGADYENAVRLRPDFPDAWLNLGAVRRAAGALGAAVEAFRRARALAPGSAEALRNLGATLLEQGLADEAVAALEGAGDAAAQIIRTMRLFSLNYLADRSAADIAEAHRRWGVDLERETAASPHAVSAPANPQRPVRVGYVSADFREHSCAYFFEPLIAAHDRSAFEIFCYNDSAKADAVTERLMGYKATWRGIAGESDAAVVERIAADRIDILVDLCGHTSPRLQIFARKPAPLQVAWLGYPATTGLSRIDYRIVDQITDPDPEADHAAIERLWRIAPCFLCFRPPDDAPEITGLPARREGRVTFGSFNALAKMSRRTLDAWSRVLVAVPEARFLLKRGGLDDPATRAIWLKRLAAAGIPEDRLLLLPMTRGRAAHLAVYSQVDIALDTFPYNGTTTTCEALWMGVPTVTLIGDRHSARVGASLLAAAGLRELVADDVDSYVAAAAGLARDLERLERLRSTARARLLASPLLDSGGFAATIEAAYREMWRLRSGG